MQTVMIQHASHFNRIHRLERRPALPVSERWRHDAHQTVRMTLNNGDSITWYFGMTVYNATDGHIYTWFDKPTIADAVQNSMQRGHRDVHIFHTDGSVTARWFGADYFWPAGECETYIAEGSIVEPTHFHHGEACYANCEHHYHDLTYKPCYEYDCAAHYHYRASSQSLTPCYYDCKERVEVS